MLSKLFLYPAMRTWLIFYLLLIAAYPRVGPISLLARAAPPFCDNMHFNTFFNRFFLKPSVSFYDRPALTTNPQLCMLTATQVLDMLKKDTITVEEYAVSLLDRIEERDSTVKAWVYLGEKSRVMGPYIN